MNSRNLIPIAPASLRGDGLHPDSSDTSHMPYICRTCARRKVKCDKALPVCFGCRRSKLECVYLAPVSKERKRKASSDIHEKLAQYEAVLRRHDLLDQVPASGASSAQQTDEIPAGTVSLRWDAPGTSETGKLMALGGQSKYVDDKIWSALEQHEELENVSAEEEEEEVDTELDVLNPNVMADPLTGAFMLDHASLLQCHPTHTEAMSLWSVHIDRVEPLCKILHIPSTSNMVEKASRRPSGASKEDQCLLFAIYHFAVYALTNDECIASFGQDRADLLLRYQLAARQALVNAFFLKTTNMVVLQALVLFLLATRHTYDADTYWILTGVALRIAQRIGLHRDGEKLGLPPFEVQIRRRLFYQVLPLDGVATIMAGIGMSGLPREAWDTKPALNVDDAQIWPGMRETPLEQNGATEMMFCLARASLGKVTINPQTWQLKDIHEAEIFIRQTEQEVQDNFLRYCDMVHPLHYLTNCMARSSLSALRMRVRLPQARKQTLADPEMREVFEQAQKVLDTDISIHCQPGLKKFRWFIEPIFLWGTWDALIFLMNTIWKNARAIPASDLAGIWERVSQTFANHPELLQSKRALHVAFRRLTIRSWDALPTGHAIHKPSFIEKLRAMLKSRSARQPRRTQSNEESPCATTNSDSTAVAADLNNADILFGAADISGDAFGLENVDWAFWDDLLYNRQVKFD